MADDDDERPEKPELAESAPGGPETTDAVAPASDTPDAAGGGVPAGEAPVPQSPTAWMEGEDGLRDLMARHFIEYASYVIKERAIPDVNDGMKPVQRRILHCLLELHDGRFHKVANVIGSTMRYHPHGDASIGDALVVLANKEFFIDKQGNFGNIHTGDPASAARYIECRLSPLGREVLFNPEITEFVDSYDGRNREPVTLPAKVPALLMMGAEGVAVGMTTKVFPHNFTELLQAQIAILRGEPFQVFPDFQTGGIMDASEYADGAGRVRIRARIEVVNEKTLVIREVPFSTTTESLIASIEDAVNRGKLKISSINDYTAERVEVEITLPRGVYADETVTRLYGYTDCEINLTSNLTVIKDNRPVQMTVSEVLHHNTDKLVEDLRRELEIELGKLNDRFFEKSLAQLFIEHRIYKRIEKSETLEAVQHEVRSGMEQLLADYFKEHAARFKILEYHGKTIDIPPPRERPITDADIEKLLQLQIRRISLFDINRNQQEIDDILALIGTAQDNLAHLKRFTIKFIENLIKKYGHLHPRHTQVGDLAAVNVREVALRNLKVGHDKSGQFAGYGVKNSNKDQEPLACSEFDRLVLLRNDGVFKVVPMAEKLYVGPVKQVLLADRYQVYSMLYRDRKSGVYYAKRFRIDSYIMDKEYRTLPENCLIEALYTNYGVVVNCEFVPKKHQRTTQVEVDFDTVEIRSASARGFRVTEHEIARIIQVKRGSATLQAEAGGETPPAAAGDAGAPPAAPEAAPGSPPAAPAAPPPAPVADSASPEPAETADEPPARERKTPGKPGKRGGKKAAPTAPAAEPPPPPPVPSSVGPGRKPRKKATAAEVPAPPAAVTPQAARTAAKPAATPPPAELLSMPEEVEAPPADAPVPKKRGDATTRPPATAKTRPPRGDAKAGGTPGKRIDEDTPFFLE
ncbi:MAG: DNA topoisomerase IV subunit A [Lentisphaeria bacterium]